MKIIADFCLVPLGVEISLSVYVAKCQEVLERFPVKTKMHAYGTNLEGEWEDVMAAVKACHEQLHAQGVPRISTTLKLGSRTDKNQGLEDKIKSVEKFLKKHHTS